MGARSSTANMWTEEDEAELDWLAAIARNLILALSTIISSLCFLAVVSFHRNDASLNAASTTPVGNWLGGLGASLADFSFQFTGVLSLAIFAIVAGASAVGLWQGPRARRFTRLQKIAFVLAWVFFAAALAGFGHIQSWPFAVGLGGYVGDVALGLISMPFLGIGGAKIMAALLAAVLSISAMIFALRLRLQDFNDAIESLLLAHANMRVWFDDLLVGLKGQRPNNGRKSPSHVAAVRQRIDKEQAKFERAPERTGARTSARDSGVAPTMAGVPSVAPVAPTIGQTIANLGANLGAKLTLSDDAIDLSVAQKKAARQTTSIQTSLPIEQAGFQLPRLELLTRPRAARAQHDHAALKQNAHLLMSVLTDFGVRGEIVHIRPGPVVTLYELKLASGVKAARVIGLADDIARTMSAVSCRVSQVKSRGVIGIELPNATRETVYLQSLLATKEFEDNRNELPLALGEGIGGEATITNLAKMPHLLIAGTTGSGKSVGVNAMILSLLFKLTPEQCRFIMIDPKMLELSVYDGIPHLLAPVVTDPKKAVSALKWTVREMESRYELMSKVGVRNITGFNEKAVEFAKSGKRFTRTSQTGWDRDSGDPIYDTFETNLTPFPYIVVVIDEMADLMLVAGKDIEGAVQRLAQMARAAGIHLIMATQRPSVDVITGTIKANFPTRISYTVTSKIDSRTILGEQGAEQLLGQGDLLWMAQGGGIKRLHGPFVSDEDVEKVVAKLKEQGSPHYFEDITEDVEEGASSGDYAAGGAGAGTGSGNELFDQAVAIVSEEQVASTSRLQRRLQIGYNRAANLIERMEKEGMISKANHVGRRDVFLPPPNH